MFYFKYSLKYDKYLFLSKLKGVSLSPDILFLSLTVHASVWVIFINFTSFLPFASVGGCGRFWFMASVPATALFARFSAAFLPLPARLAAVPSVFPQHFFACCLCAVFGFAAKRRRKKAPANTRQAISAKAC